MIRLDKTTRKLQAVMAGAKTTTQPQVVVSYYDENQSGEKTKGATQVAILNDTTDVDICAAPSQNFVRCIESVSVPNIDTVANVISIKIDDGGTDSIIVKKSIPAGSNLVYEQNAGWAVV